MGGAPAGGARDPAGGPRRARPGRARARRAGRARARRPGGARRRRRRRVEYAIYGAPGELPDAAATCARPRAARSSTSRRPSCPTTGTSAGAPGTGRRRRRPAPDAARAPAVGASRCRARSTSSIEPGAGVRHRRARDDAAVAGAARCELEPAGALADWGCGSGVLAIAAAKLGWRRCSACDVEAGVGRGHARRRARPTASSVEVSRCDLRREPGPWAPTVIANLVRPLLLEVAARMERAPERLIVSGLLQRTRWTRSSPRSPRTGWRRPTRRDGDGWAAMLLTPGDHARRRPRRRAADRGRRAPHAGADLARARRGDRRAACS